MLWQHIVLCKSALLGMRLAMACVVCYVVRVSHYVTHDAHYSHYINRVLWQHIVLCKSALLGMCLAMVCVLFYFLLKLHCNSYDIINAAL